MLRHFLSSAIKWAVGLYPKNKDFPAFLAAIFYYMKMRDPFLNFIAKFAFFPPAKMKPCFEEVGERSMDGSLLFEQDRLGLRRKIRSYWSWAWRNLAEHFLY